MNTNSDLVTILSRAGFEFETIFEGEAGSCPCHALEHPATRRTESQVAA